MMMMMPWDECHRWDLADGKSILVQVMAWCCWQQAITWTNVDPDLCHHMASQLQNKLNEPILLQKIGTTSTNWCAAMFVFVETIETTTTTTISPGPDGKLISTEERMVQVRGGGEQSAHVTTTGEGPREVVVAGYQHQCGAGSVEMCFSWCCLLSSPACGAAPSPCVLSVGSRWGED